MRRCEVCGCKDFRREVVDDVFHFENEYFLIKGVPALVCERCEENTFTANVVETVRAIIHGSAEPDGTVPLEVFDFDSQIERASSRFDPTLAEHGA